MKELLQMKGNIAKEIKEMEDLIPELQKSGNYTGITKLNQRLEHKKDIKKLIDIIYPLL